MTSVMSVTGFCTCSISSFARSMSAGLRQKLGVRSDRVEARHAARRVARGRQLVGLRDVVDDRAPIDSECHRPPLIHVGDVLHVDAVVVGARGAVCSYSGSSLSRGISSGGRPPIAPVSSTSPASNACTAVVPSVIMRPFTRFSATSSALRHSSHLTRSSAELCSQFAIWNGPFVTMFAASVQRSPNCSIVGWWTARNEWCAELLQKPRLRARQLDPQRPVVDRGDTDLVPHRLAVLLARVVVVSAHDSRELIRVVCGQLR